MNVTLWLEITIAGAVYLLAVAFWVLISLSTTDAQLSSLSGHLEEYLPYVAVGFAAASYVVGILTHRVIQLTPRKLINLFLVFVSPESETYVTGDRENRVRIWQYGSERLHRELDFQYGLVALIRSLIISVPLLGGGVATWLHSSNREGTWQAVVLAAIVWLACVLALGRQWQNYFHTEMVAARVLKSVEVKAAQESEAGEMSDGSRNDVKPPPNPSLTTDGRGRG